MRVSKNVNNVIKLGNIITMKEAARILHKKVQTVYYYINTGKLPVFPVRGAILLDRNDVLAFAVRGIDFSEGTEDANSTGTVAGQ